MKLTINRTRYDVRDLAHASEVWCEIRDRLGLGASDMWEGCGDVHDARGVLVGHVSYNRKVTRS